MCGYVLSCSDKMNDLNKWPKLELFI